MPVSTSTYQEGKILPGNSQKCHWNRTTGDYNPSTDPINHLTRHEQTTIFKLRAGHCGLRAHLKWIGIMVSALCDCKEAEQTVHHILQDCPIWRKQTPVMAVGWVNHQQAVGNGRRPALHHPISMADRPQKKKKITWRKEECWNGAAEVPPSEVWNDLCSTRPTCVLFWGAALGRLLRDGDGMLMGLSKCYDAILNENRKLGNV